MTDDRERYGPFVLLDSTRRASGLSEHLAYDTSAVGLVRMLRLTRPELPGYTEAFDQMARLMAAALRGPSFLGAWAFDDDPISAVAIDPRVSFPLSRIGVDQNQRPVPLQIAIALMRGTLEVARDAARLQQYSFSSRGIVVVNCDGDVHWRPDLGVDWDEYMRGTATGTLRGTFELLSPEAARGMHLVPQTTQWSAAVLAAQWLIARKPFGQRSDIEKIRAIAECDTAFLDDKRIPDPIREMLSRMLRQDPDARFETFDAWSAALDDIEAQLGAASPEDLKQWCRSLMADDIERYQALIEETELWDILPPTEDTKIELGPPSTWEQMPAPMEVHAHAVGDDGRPMFRVSVGGEVRLVDVLPVSADEYARFVVETGHRAPSSWPGPTPSDEQGPRPVTDVDFEDAAAYARWANKRLLDDDEWSAALAQHGEERLGVGAVWEWTRTPFNDGRVVRGGPWRDRAGVGEGGNASWESGPASDLGFRCISDHL